MPSTASMVTRATEPLDGNRGAHGGDVLAREWSRALAAEPAELRQHGPQERLRGLLTAPALTRIAQVRFRFVVWVQQVKTPSVDS